MREERLNERGFASLTETNEWFIKHCVIVLPGPKGKDLDCKVFSVNVETSTPIQVNPFNINSIEIIHTPRENG